MLIRLAKVTDKKMVLELLDELLDEIVVSGSNIKKNKSTTLRAREKIFEELLKRDDVKIFVAEENKQVIGVCDLFILPIMRRGFNHGHVEDLVVTLTLRGKGVGTKLLNHVKNYCLKNGIKVIKLTSDLVLTPAHRFYEKNGGVYTEKMFRFNL